MNRLAALVGLGLVSCSAAPVATVQPGIDLDLAQHRAATISNVRYGLFFGMQKGMQAVTGEATIGFALRERGRVVLDFAGSDLGDVRLNGEAVAFAQEHNHIVLPDVPAGDVTFHATFRSKAAPTGTPLTVYRDKSDGAEYYYTLVVPADAHRLFPCFDQPDLKGRYSLSIDAPGDWQVIANGAPIGRTGTRRQFATTRPLSTYLFAFAAGPFEALVREPETDTQRALPMTMYVRKSKLPKLERDLLFAMHDNAAQWLGDYFDYPYPFGKLDMVLLPGFPYGGMEHAGAIFYRESSLVFEQPPTEGELTRRSTLIYHEVSHQWFGNLVTMRWFDDLWLKEGFATFMGYTLFETLEPGKHAWLRFHHRVKPRAYHVDGTTGTTPVYQKLQNLADAKSAYGAIVYNKAPAIIRELNHRLGPAVFQKGLQIFLKRHEFANATWQQLVAALEEAAGQSATHWSSRWILAKGMPKVRAVWSTDNEEVTSFAVQQESVQGDTGTWPLQLEVLFIKADGSHERVKIVADGANTKVDAFLGKVTPACVVLNPGDVAYGQFLLDAVSREWLVAHAQSIHDPLVRAVAMSALWETVREAELDPAEFTEVAIRLLKGEKDAGTHAWLLGRLGTCVRRYMTASRAQQWVERIRDVLLHQLAGENQATKTQSLRFLLRVCHSVLPPAFARVIAAGRSPIQGLSIGKRDRFLAATVLVAQGHREPLAELIASYGTEDVAREAYIAGAADPAPDRKAAYFAGYANLDEPPEQWISISLGNFHWPGQEAKTLPYLRKALDMVDWVKKNRKVFFMPAWIDAFVNGHSSPAALDEVRRFLDEYSGLTIDIRRKILQSLDSLQRAVRIRRRFQ